MPRADVRMVMTLAFRHLFVKPGRALVLWFGFAVGAGVMMVLLSVGEAMLTQSRDVNLVGGGQVTVLPEGIDFEGLRTGSMSGLFFGIDRARFLERQLVGGRRLDDAVSATSPVIEHKLVYLERAGLLVALRAGGELPSAARAVGAGLNLVAGAWDDSPDDRRFARPTPEQLYHELDRFHAPAADSTWAEWHYFNLAPSADEWWYITYLVGGLSSAGLGGGQLLVTRHRVGRAPARFESTAPVEAIRFDTTTADLTIGRHTVTQREGRYQVQGQASGPSGSVRFDLTIVPEPNAYFPPIELKSDRFLSGYVVPVLRGTATGTVCEGAECRRFTDVAAYHDHNWGVWRQTTWNWGQARGSRLSLVYGGVLNTDSASSPYFLAAVDSQGVRQILRFSRIDFGTSRPAPGGRFSLKAVREPDTLRLDVSIRNLQTTPIGTGSANVQFLQMRGQFTARGRLLGIPVADSGLGFFETFTSGTPPPP